MRVHLKMHFLSNDPEIIVKEYPLARDKEEARSMMFRDNSKAIMGILYKGGRVDFNVEKIKEAPLERVL